MAKSWSMLEDEKDRGLPRLIPKPTRDGNQTAYWNSFNCGINCVRVRHWIGQGIEDYLIHHLPDLPHQSPNETTSAVTMLVMVVVPSLGMRKKPGSLSKYRNPAN